MQTTNDKIHEIADQGKDMAIQLKHSEELAKRIGRLTANYLKEKHLNAMPFNNFLNMTNNAVILSYSNYFQMIMHEKNQEQQKAYYAITIGGIESLASNLMANREKWIKDFQKIFPLESV
jgi:hypothetical protein